MLGLAMRLLHLQLQILLRNIILGHNCCTMLAIYSTPDLSFRACRQRSPYNNSSDDGRGLDETRPCAPSDREGRSAFAIGMLRNEDLTCYNGQHGAAVVPHHNSQHVVLDNVVIGSYAL